MRSPDHHPARTSPLLALLLLWLAGIALRLTILAVPPVIPLIHDDLRLSEKQIGILAGLPMVLFAGAAIAGSLLIARLGALTTIVAGLVLCAVGSALRGVGPHIAMLYLGTIVTAFGVAVMQPSLPPLVRAWVPQRIGFATAVYTNGLIVGEIVPVGLTVPYLLPAIGQSWQWSFVIWGAPVALLAVLMLTMAPRPVAADGTTPARDRQWMPDFRNPLIWRIGFLLGGVNSMYFSLNGFLPDYLTHTGRADLIHGALIALNFGQLPASFLLLASADRLVRTGWSYAVCGVACFASVLMIVFLGGVWVIVGAAAIGFFAAAILVLVLALPPLIGAPQDVHRLTAGMFSISYSCAVLVPIVSGLLWDLTGLPAIAFVPVGLCALVVIGLAPTIVLREQSATCKPLDQVDMDVFEAVDSRIACRAFLDKPVDLNIVKDLIVRAQRAASGGNLQSWNIYALTGAPLAEFKAIVQKRIAIEDPRHTKSEYPIYPDPMWGAYKERREAHGVQLYGSLGIGRDDAAGRLSQYKKNFEFFDAPVALFITIDRRLGPGQWADLGGYIHALAFLARGHGLDTCPQEAWARLYDTVGDYLKLPDNEMLFCAVAIGYGDRKHKANDFRSPRAELNEFCKFYGFD